ncbi:hypothetical protein GW17_00053406 [Ensete ventricosum]|nr:hypothetical protein GW17_00053406 [Ensete ventricosum]RZR95979.1 hypothetical protein BHM03_00024891 [Ensete ventricosum]
MPASVAPEGASHARERPPLQAALDAAGRPCRGPGRPSRTLAVVSRPCRGLAMGGHPCRGVAMVDHPCRGREENRRRRPKL